MRLCRILHQHQNHVIPVLLKSMLENSLWDKDIPFVVFSWDIGEWSECSKTCGLGMQHRQILCRQIYANRTLTVQQYRCQHLEKPDTTSTCQLKICSEWQIRTEWTSVSRIHLFEAEHLRKNTSLLPDITSRTSIWFCLKQVEY